MAGCCRKPKPERGSPSYSDWMSHLPTQLHSVPLNTIAIPGSHDSFTSSMDDGSSVAPNCPGVAADLCKIFGTAGKKVVLRWSITQNSTFAGQLEAGIRYLDLRVAYRPKKTQAYFCHGLYAGEVEIGLQQVADFLEQHPKEIVLLDFNHFYNMTPTSHQNLLNYMVKLFGEKLCPALDMNKVTLDNLWSSGRQVIVFYHDDKSISKYSQFWSGNYIPSPWPNTYSSGKLLSVLEANYNKSRSPKTFYVTQGVLTPDTAYVLKHLFGGLEDDLSSKIAPQFVSWLETKKAGLKGINICIMDCVDMADYIDQVILLNSRY